MKTLQPKPAALGAVHPPNLQLHMLDERPPYASTLGYFIGCEARAPAHIASARDLGTPRSFERHAFLEAGGNQQLVHFLVAEQNGAIVIGEPSGVAQRSGDSRHQPGHCNRHDQGGDQNLEQSEPASGSHGSVSGGAVSTRGTPVMGSTRTTR